MGDLAKLIAPLTGGWGVALRETLSRELCGSWQKTQDRAQSKNDSR